MEGGTSAAGLTGQELELLTFQECCFQRCPGAHSVTLGEMERRVDGL